MRGTLEVEKAHNQSGLDTDAFTIDWLLKQENLPNPMPLSKEISGVSALPKLCEHAEYAWPETFVVSMNNTNECNLPLDCPLHSK